MINPFIINSIGLVFDISGAILIFIGSEKLANIIGRITLKLAERAGRFDITMEPQVFKDYWKESKTANKLNRWGIKLLVLGFACQLVASLMK